MSVFLLTSYGVFSHRIAGQYFLQFPSECGVIYRLLKVDVMLANRTLLISSVCCDDDFHYLLVLKWNPKQM